MTNIAIFASGTGSNARKIIEYFKQNPNISVKTVISNKADAGVLAMAKAHGIETHIIKRDNFYKTTEIIEYLIDRKIDFIVLAGFLWLVPTHLVEAFPNKIVNIHPALLPKYGGKGMYGMNVHQAVFDAKEKESGITIHYVNEHYDEGNIIFQASCVINEHDTPQSIAQKVQILEHKHFPSVIASLFSD